MEFFVENISSAILVPLWIFLILMVGRFTGALKSKKLAFIITLAGSIYGNLMSLFGFIYISMHQDYVLEITFPFLQIKNLIFSLGLCYDIMSSILLVVFFTINTLIVIYSYKYLNTEKSFIRFFGLINFFTFSMSALIVSGSLFQSYIFWEMIGLSSYLLISYAYNRETASTAGRRAFIINRIGDCGLLTGYIICAAVLLNYTNNTSLITIPFLELERIAPIIYTYTSEIQFDVICVMLLFGSIAKSAQIPLHTWLADAMEGPTPASALLHSATIVTAGVCLVARLYPLYYHSEIVLTIITTIGLTTAIICAFAALTETNIKRILAYSTSSQMGLMFLTIGCGCLTGGVLHLITHAFAKAMLFLIAGVAIIGLFREFNIKKMGGIRKFCPTIAVCYIIGVFSLTGLLFSGLSSKSIILYCLLEKGNPVFLVLFYFVSFMTAFYLTRLYYYVFEGEPKFEGQLKSNPWYNAPIVGFAVLVIVLFFCLPHMHNGKFSLLSILISLSGIILGILCYHTEKPLPRIPILYDLSVNNLYVNQLYAFISKTLFAAVAKIFNSFEVFVLDGAVGLVAFLARIKSWILNRLQTGNVQSYLSYSFIIISLLFTLFIVVYSLLAYVMEV